MFISVAKALIFLRYFSGLSILGFTEPASNRMKENYAHTHER